MKKFRLKISIEKFSRVKQLCEQINKPVAEQLIILGRILVNFFFTYLFMFQNLERVQTYHGRTSFVLHPFSKIFYLNLTYVHTILTF